MPVYNGATVQDYSLVQKQIKPWAPNTFYPVGTQVIAPTNEVVSSKADHTSGATYSASSWNNRTATTAAIASPSAIGVVFSQAELASTKTAIDAIRAALISAE